MSHFYPMKRTEKLTENSLQEAVTLINETLEAAVEACYSSGDYGNIVNEIQEAWDLLICFGDLDDADGMFSEFYWQYNDNNDL